MLDEEESLPQKKTKQTTSLPDFISPIVSSPDSNDNTLNSFQPTIISNDNIVSEHLGPSQETLVPLSLPSSIPPPFISLPMSPLLPLLQSPNNNNNNNNNNNKNNNNNNSNNNNNNNNNNKSKKSITKRDRDPNPSDIQVEILSSP